MVPVATERLIASHQTPSGELTDEELEEEEVAAAWAADVLQFPSSLELDIRVHKGAEPLGKNQQEHEECRKLNEPTVQSLHRGTD